MNDWDKYAIIGMTLGVLPCVRCRTPEDRPRTRRRLASLLTILAEGAATCRPGNCTSSSPGVASPASPWHTA